MGFGATESYLLGNPEIIAESLWAWFPMGGSPWTLAVGDFLGMKRGLPSSGSGRGSAAPSGFPQTFLVFVACHRHEEPTRSIMVETPAPAPAPIPAPAERSILVEVGPPQAKKLPLHCPSGTCSGTSTPGQILHRAASHLTPHCSPSHCYASSNCFARAQHIRAIGNAASGMTSEILGMRSAFSCGSSLDSCTLRRRAGAARQSFNPQFLPKPRQSVIKTGLGGCDIVLGGNRAR